MVRWRRGFGATAFTSKDSRMAAGDDGEKLPQVGERDKGER
jgi:hypothetical protein